MKEAMARPLFLAGNKRSGTSQLVRLVNLHPRLFVSHESDIAWILYQFHHNRSLAARSWDSDRGMRTAMEIAGGAIADNGHSRGNFAAFQIELMRRGSPWLPPQDKESLAWIGDKKPLQHTDPELLAFILHHLPDAQFVHIVRHPFEVVESSDRFNRTANGDFWLGLTPEEKLERWTFHEEQVLSLRERLPDQVHTVRYEDLCRQTAQALAGVFAFLQVDADPSVLR